MNRMFVAGVLLAILFAVQVYATDLNTGTSSTSGEIAFVENVGREQVYKIGFFNFSNYENQELNITNIDISSLLVNLNSPSTNMTLQTNASQMLPNIFCVKAGLQPGNDIFCIGQCLKGGE